MVLRAVAMDAFSLGRSMKALRIRTEQNHCRIGWLAAVEQIEMSQQRLRRGVGFEREATLAASGLKKPVDTFAREIR